jgi:hypothetical protein
VRRDLRTPIFDARSWDDEELLLLLQQMYLDYDLCSKFAIDINTLRNFLYEVYKNYNEVPFHNFRHCFCVAQMVSYRGSSVCFSLNSFRHDKTFSFIKSRGARSFPRQHVTLNSLYLNSFENTTIPSPSGKSLDHAN